MQRPYSSGEKNLMGMTGALTLVSLIASGGQYADSSQFGWIYLLTLTTPYWFAAMALCLPLWIARRRWIIAATLTLILFTRPTIAYDWVRTCCTHIEPTPKPARHLRIATYNIHAFQDKDYHTCAQELAQWSHRYEIDLLCMQEYYQAPHYNADSIGALLGMPYHYFYEKQGQILSTALFSRYPLHRLEQIDLHSHDRIGLYAQMLLPDSSTLNIATIHLQSSFFSRYVEHVQHNKKELFRIPDSLIITEAERHTQAQLAATFARTHTERFILCGDFNATPYTNIHKIFSSHLKDSYHATRTNIRTYTVHPLLKMRIDYLFHTPDLKPTQAFSTPDTLSDHRPYIVELPYPTKANQSK